MEEHSDPQMLEWTARNQPSSARYSTFSGADIKCAFFFPNAIILHSEPYVSFTSGYKVFAELQTLTISSARTVDPVRVLGQAEPVGFTRGPRTIAGSMIFTDILKDVLAEVLQFSRRERTSKYDFFVDQVPEFNIIINGHNEAGQSGVRVVAGVTLANYGSTYSIDDLFTESTYTYVARGVTPFMPADMWRSSLRDKLAQVWDPGQAQRASDLAVAYQHYFTEYEEKVLIDQGAIGMRESDYPSDPLALP